MSAYAATAKEAAALAPEGQRDALGNFAEFLESLAVDPTAEGTADRAFALVASMITIQLSGAGTVLVDRHLESPEGRLVAYRDDNAFHPVDLWPAFAAACEGAVPLWIPAS
jgi:hypothetical protein